MEELKLRKIKIIGDITKGWEMLKVVDAETGDAIRCRSVRFECKVGELPHAVIDVVVDEIDVVADALSQEK